eukprot:s454_g8.t1
MEDQDGNTDQLNKRVIIDGEEGMWVLEGDEVVAVNGTNVEGKSLDEVGPLVKNSEGLGSPSGAWPGARSAASTVRDVKDETLEALEQEVESLRRAIEKEQAEVATLTSSLGELFMRNSCEEYLLQLEKRIQVIENRNVEDRTCRRCAISTSEGRLSGLTGVFSWWSRRFPFSLLPQRPGCSEMLKLAPGKKRGTSGYEGYCSLYLHVPQDTKVSRTLFVGRARHGPSEADALKNCGVSEMCVLSNQIDKDTGSVVIGVEDLQVLSSPLVAETRTKLQLFQGDSVTLSLCRHYMAGPLAAPHQAKVKVVFLPSGKVATMKRGIEISKAAEVGVEDVSFSCKEGWCKACWHTDPMFGICYRACSAYSRKKPPPKNPRTIPMTWNNVVPLWLLNWRESLKWAKFKKAKREEEKKERLAQRAAQA